MTVEVVDGTGAPVAGAWVFASRVDRAASGSVCGNAAYAGTCGSTDESGRYRFQTNLEPRFSYYVGMHVGEARFHGWPAARCGDTEGTLITVVRVRPGTAHQVRLAPSPGPSVVEGVLHFRGAPVPRAVVSVDAAAAVAPLVGGDACTDEDGRFRLELARAGTYRFSVDAESSRSGASAVSFVRRTFLRDVPEGHNEWTLEIPDRGVRGALRDPSGHPVVGMSVAALGHDADLRDWLAGTRSDEHGRFEFAGLDPGPWTVRTGRSWGRDARDRAFAPFETSFRLTEEPGYRTVDIELAACRPLDGYVVDRTGEPVGGAYVYWRHAGIGAGWQWGIGRSDEHGHFGLECAPDAAVELHAAGGECMASRVPVTVEPGEVALVTVDPATRVHVFCQDASGAPRAARFSLTSALGHAVPLGLQSSFAYERDLGVLVPGSYTFEVATFEGAVIQQQVDIHDMDVGNWVALEVP